MPPILRELVERRSWEEDTQGFRATRYYTIDTNDIDVAKGYGPLIGDTYPGHSDLFVHRKFSEQDGERSLITVEYRTRANEFNDVATSVLEFDTSAQMVHIDGGLNVIENKQEIIGSEREGTEIYVGSFTETYSQWVASITAAYVATLQDLTGSINRYAWHNYQPRSVLFLGAQGRRQGQDYWQITYRFVYQRDKTVRVYGSGGPTQDVDGKSFAFQTYPGWYYVWNDVDEVIPADGPLAGKAIIVVGQTHVTSVYPEKDFSVLNI